MNKTMNLTQFANSKDGKALARFFEAASRGPKIEYRAITNDDIARKWTSKAGNEMIELKQELGGKQIVARDVKYYAIATTSTMTYCASLGYLAEKLYAEGE